MKEAKTHTTGLDTTLLQIISQVQAGSREAYLQLLGRYRPLLESSVARFITADMSQQDKEDLREEAERVFLNAASSYDTEQDAVDFGLYAKICLRNGLISEWRHLRARRRLETLPLEGEFKGRSSDDPSVALEEEERFRWLYRFVRDHLSDFENQVWWLYVSGIEVKEIAQRLERDDRSIHNAIYRIRHKLRTLLAER